MRRIERSGGSESQAIFGSQPFRPAPHASSTAEHRHYENCFQIRPQTEIRPVEKKVLASELQHCPDLARRTWLRPLSPACEGASAIGLADSMVREAAPAAAERVVRRAAAAGELSAAQVALAEAEKATAKAAKARGEARSRELDSKRQDLAKARTAALTATEAAAEAAAEGTTAGERNAKKAQKRAEKLTTRLETLARELAEMEGVTEAAVCPTWPPMRLGGACVRRHCRWTL